MQSRNEKTQGIMRQDEMKYDLGGFRKGEGNMKLEGAQCRMATLGNPVRGVDDRKDEEKPNKKLEKKKEKMTNIDLRERRSNICIIGVSEEDNQNNEIKQVNNSFMKLH